MLSGRGDESKSVVCWCGTINGSDLGRGPARAGASPPPSAQDCDERAVALGQACHLPVQPLDSHLQGFVLPALPLDVLPQGFVLPALPLYAPPQSFDLPGVPPLFRLVLRGQQMDECVDLFVPVGLTDSAARIPAD